MKQVLQRLSQKFSLVLTSGPETDDTWQELRAQLLDLVVIGSVILGTLVLLPSSLLTIKEGKWGMAAFDFLAYEWVLSLLLFRNYLSYKARAYSICILVYAIGLAIFYTLGPLRSGITYLFCFQVMATVLLGGRAALYAGLLNLSALFTIGIMLQTGTMEWGVPLDQPVFRWFVMAVNFTFMNTVVTVLIIAVANGMARALAKEKIAEGRIRETNQEKILTDQALQASEERFTMAMQGTREGMWDWDLQTRKIRYSPVWKRLLGYEDHEVSDNLEELIGRTHPQDKGLVHEALDVMSEGSKERVSLECRMRNKDGSYHIHRIVARIQRDANGLVLRVVGSHLDMTRENLTENALRESEEKYRALVEQSLQGVAIIGVNPPRMLYCNPAICRILGRSSHELLNTPPGEMKKWVDQEDWHSVVRCFEQCLEGKPLPSILEYRLRGRERQRVWVEATGSVIRYQGQDAIMVHGLDISQRKLAGMEKETLEIQLDESRKTQMLGRFAGDLAHDYAKYLSPIMGYAEMAVQDLPNGHPARKDLMEVVKAARGARELTEQVRELSRPSRRAHEASDLAMLVDDAVRQIRTELSHDVRITPHISKQCGLVWGDPLQIRQVIQILCDKVLHEMEHGQGELVVLLEERYLSERDLPPQSILSPGHYVALTIADSSPGSLVELSANSYDPYSLEKTQGKTGGVSLALAHTLVKKHNGHIEVRVQAEKQWAYTVLLPVENNVSPAATVVPEIQDLPTGNERILLVDDEKPILDMTRQTLERLGYRVTALTESMEAWERFRESPEGFDIVVTDYNMPGMTGDVLAQKMLSVRKEIPIVMCTGFSERFSEHRAKALGIAEYVTKPVLMHEFAHTVRHVLDGERGRQAPGNATQSSPAEAPVIVGNFGRAQIIPKI